MLYSEHYSVHLYNTPGGKMVNAVHCTLQCTPHQETISSENFTEKNIWYTWCCTYFFSLQISYQIQRTWQRIPTEEKPNLGCKYNVNTMQKAPRHSVALERTADVGWTNTWLPSSYSQLCLGPDSMGRQPSAQSLSCKIHRCQIQSKQMHIGAFINVYCWWNWWMDVNLWYLTTQHISSHPNNTEQTGIQYSDCAK